MRRIRRIVVTLAVTVAVVAPLSATADVIEPYESERTNYDVRYACAGVSDSSIDGYGYTAACAYVETYEGSAYAAIEVIRRDCTFEGSFQTCTEKYGSGSVDPAAVVIDLEAATANISGSIDSCAVQMQLVGSDGGSYGFSSWGFAPGLRTRDMSVRTHRGWEFREDYQSADGTGSVCDWFAGEWDGGEMGRFSDVDREAGYRLNPEDLPGAGGAFSRGERQTDSSASEYACGLWDVYTTESDTYIDACAENYDDDADGTIDSTLVSVWRGVCDGAGCQSELRSSTEATLSVDIDAAAAHIAGSIDDCTVDVALQGDPSSRYTGSYEGGYDSVGPGAEPGEVTLGESYSGTYDAMYADPSDGAVVCDWTEIAAADWRGGFMEQSNSETRSQYLAVDPTAILP